jgi:cytochrome c nitrite reductase small subunit
MSSRAIALLVVAVLFGIAAGLGGYTFVYARGSSYLTDDPAACANCHVMQEQYDGWIKSSHRSVAVCNDCHTPHAFLAKYYTKALNGYHHSRAFTSGEFHEPIQIKERNLDVTERACRGCHADIVQEIDHPGETLEPISCIRCHDSVGHLK